MTVDKYLDTYLQFAEEIIGKNKFIESNYSYLFVGIRYVLKIQKYYSSLLGLYTIQQLKINAMEEFKRGKEVEPDIYIDCVEIVDKKYGICNYGIVAKTMKYDCLLENIYYNLTFDDMNKLYCKCKSYIYSADLVEDINYFSLLDKGNERLYSLLEIRNNVISEKLILYWMEIINKTKQLKGILTNRETQQKVKAVHGDLSFKNIYYDDKFYFLDPCAVYEDMYCLDVLYEMGDITSEFIRVNEFDKYNYLVERIKTEKEFLFQSELFEYYLKRHLLIRATTSFLAGDLSYREYIEVFINDRKYNKFFEVL